MPTKPPIRRAFGLAVMAAAIIPAAMRARRQPQPPRGDAAAPAPPPAAAPREASHMRSLPTEIADEEFAAIVATHRSNPPTRDQLVGLALSGGGIRSATFGLGVLEALKDADLLKRIHYLSTVSGGGYIGGWFSANCKRAVERNEAARKATPPRPPEPHWWERSADWGRSIEHLRRYSNYLSPQVGFFSADTWSMFTVWIRNALLVQWTVMLAVACLLLVPRLLPEPFVSWYGYHHWRWLGVLAFVTAVAGIAGNQQRVSRGKPAWIMRSDHWLYSAGISLACLVTGVWYALATGFDPFGDTPVPLGSALFEAALVVLGSYTLLLVGVAMYGYSTEGEPVALNYSQAHVQWLIVLPLVATGFFVGAVLWAEATPLKPVEAALLRVAPEAGVAFGFKVYDTYSDLFLRGWRVWPFPLAVVFFSIWLLSLSSVARIWKWGSGLAAMLAPCVCVIALHAMLCGILLLLRGWATQGHVAHAFVVAPPLVLFAFSIAVVVLIGMVGRQSTEGVREWWSRLGAWLLIYGAAWTAVTVVSVYGPDGMYAAFREKTWTSVGAALTWIGTVGAGLFAGHSGETGTDDQRKGNTWLSTAATVAPYLFIAGLLVGVSTVIDLIVQANGGGRWWDLARPGAPGVFAQVSWWTLVVAAGILGLLGWRIDINEFSLNAFYRNRLVRCFLGATRPRYGERQPQNFTGFDDQDDLPLCELLKRDVAYGGGAATLYGPLPILNCALNLGGAGDLALHTRQSASFTLTPFRAGSDYRHEDLPAPPDAPTPPVGANAIAAADEEARLPQVGFVATAIAGSASSRISLGRAIAVSGAAASPNMGYHTSPVVSFLLTVFNLRLGWWFPRPDTAAAKQWSPSFSLPYMFTELFGGATFRSKFLMISDGGHFENLAAYELIKRGCRLVIVSDAECDPDLTFEGLGTLIRMCEVDFGVQIAIDVNALRHGTDRRWSPYRAAVGTIVYPDGPRGTLVYLKASMTGHEPTPVLQYKTSHPTFPHETTGDQFYSEDQFESYRRLGFEVASKAFSAALAEKTVAGPESMIALGELMEKTLAPGLTNADSFTAHAGQLIDLWDKVSANTELAGLDTGLLKDAGQPPAGVSRAEFYTCLEMIQLMENVYLDLHLDDTWMQTDNRGWRELFGRWASMPQWQATWSATDALFGERFGFFVRRCLLDQKDQRRTRVAGRSPGRH